MIMLTSEMKEMVLNQQCFIGTVNADGTPNVAPKRSTRVLSDTQLFFTEGTGGATYENIKRGSAVTISVVNREIIDGYRFLGKPELQESGELYEKSCEMAAKIGMPKPKGVVIIHLTEIQTLKPGPMAGKRISKLNNM